MRAASTLSLPREGGGPEQQISAPDGLWIPAFAGKRLTHLRSFS